MEDNNTKCPKCGAETKEDTFVGKTKQFGKGHITTYAVVSCSCGNVFRGPKLSDEVMRARR